MTDRKQEIIKIYAEMSASHGAGRNYGESTAVIAALKNADSIHPLPPGMFLDVGCGNGAITQQIAEAFPDRYLMGIDMTPEQIQHAHAEHSAHNIIYSYGDAEDLPYIHAAAVICLVCVNYLDSVAGFLKSVYTRLNPGGMIWYWVQVLPEAEPQQSAIRAVWQRFAHHTNYLSRSAHIRELEAAGFTAISDHYAPRPNVPMTPKRVAILEEELTKVGLTLADCEREGWLGLCEFQGRKL
jgi:SAM-dependent methyltransferase